MRPLASCLVILLGLTTQCTGGMPSPTGPQLITGSWNGPHVSLTLTTTGGALEYDCAHGGLLAPLSTGRAGNFDVAGVHVREHGGPIRIDERPDSAAAHYVGSVDGDRMTLRVYVGADTLGPFNLARDAQRQLFKCL